jgi:hypothetical protein
MAIESDRRLDEILANQRRTPGIGAIALAVAVPTVIGLLAIGRLVNQIDSNNRQLEREETHLEATDERIRQLELRMAAIIVRIEPSTNPFASRGKGD